MGLNSAKLNRRIQIRRATSSTQDGYGNRTLNWVNLGAPLFCSRRDISDAERLVASAHWENRLVSRFVVRSSTFSRSIRHTDRLMHEGTLYEIFSIKETPPGLAFIEITAWTESIL